MKKVFIYTRFERFCHWTQAVLIVFLAITGFEIHGTFSFFGFHNAVNFHSFAGYTLLVQIIFGYFWRATTGEWKQYVPTKKNLISQIEYYLFGIFNNAQHPAKKSIKSKLNPLQRIAYLSLRLFIVPLLVITGILYSLYHFDIDDKIIMPTGISLNTIAILHTIGAFAIVIFLIGHLYLITTGHTVSSNLNAMLTGYEDLEEDDDEHTELNNTIPEEK